MSEALKSLLAKVEAATGADRVLDAYIGEAFAGYALGEALHDKHLPHYTASLDAAVALAAKVVPNWRLSVTFDLPQGIFDGEGHVYLKKPEGEGWNRDPNHPHCIYFTETADTPALALIAALLKAKIAGGQP